MTTLLDLPIQETAERKTSPPPGVSFVRRLIRGGEEDPAWVRPALMALLVGTTVLYLWDLGASGWANSFYSAAVEAGTKSWKAFFFGSFDSSNFITVDKPPASLWVMELSARVFGLNAWSILVPQALEGVATVGVVYAAVRRWFSAPAALIAGSVVALTPVAALMFRYNNPDALLVLLLTGAAYATVRAVESDRMRWLVLAGALVGVGFITKELQAMLVVPAIGLAYVVGSRATWRRRIGGLLAGGASMVTAGGWWVLAVMLTPAADRPYIGGSQNNSLWNVIFGYNGFGRLTGNETGSVTGGGGTAGGSPWGLTGLLRLFSADFGSQISWMLPAALILLVAGVVLAWRRPRRDALQTSMVLWGGILIVTALAFSLGKGIIHPYYTVALAPAIGSLVGIGSLELWNRRGSWWARALLASVIATSVIWSYLLLDRVPLWLPTLRVAIVVVGLIAAAAILWTPWLRRWLRAAVVAAGIAAALAGSFAFTVDTAVTPHSGAIPSAGPASTAGFSPGGGTAGGPPGAGRFAGGGRQGPPASARGGTFPAGGFGAGGGPTAGGGGGSPGQGAGSSLGGLLNGSSPSAALVRYLQKGAAGYKWVAATVGANEAAGYQLSTGEAVMAIGGFNGTDPWPTLQVFENLVAEHELHYLIVGGASGGSSNNASQITSWVESHFSSVTVDGATLYVLGS